MSGPVSFLSRGSSTSRTWRVALLRVVLALGAAWLTGEAAVRIVSTFLPGVRYLSTVRVKSRPQKYPNLESFLKAQAHLFPYRNWHNFYNNSLGFNDAEFEIPKPPGRYRIVALGDSFCFSMAPYPDAVQTLVERELARSCGRDLDLLNAGIAAVGLWEYRTLLELLLPLWEPDAVVLHLYLGNDGPDLFKHRDDLPFHEEPVFHSSFLTYVRNAVKILRSREMIRAGPPPPRRGHQNQAGKKGGEIVDPALPPATDQDPAFFGPLFSVEAFRKIMADEFGRLYVPEEGLERGWKPHVKLLEEMRRTAAGAGVRFLVVLYPSQLQVYPDYRQEMFDSVASLRGYRSLAADRIDPGLPNRYLLDWCARSGADCFDLTPYLSREARRESRPLYIEREAHWNILGNRLAAAGESAFLESELCPRSVDGVAPDPK
ncbi:MAG: forkhead box protein [Candidatus Methylomirabilia bacterium]